MGYYIYQRDCKFRLNKSDFDQAYKACLSMPDEDYSWISSSWKKDCATLPEVLDEWRYSPVFDTDGNIVNLEFTGQKYGSCTALFNVIAPFVESGSYIEMYGEDGAEWRFTFKDQKFSEVYPEVSWPE